MKTLLVTGFRAFADEPRNPAGELAGELRGAERHGCRIEAVILPVSRAQVLETVTSHIDRCRPEAVLGLGVALDRAVVNVEQVARNVEDYRIPDEIGQQPRGEPVIEGAPEELETTLPVNDIVGEIRAAGVPARVSHDAGAYLCNRLYYGLLHGEAVGIPGGLPAVFVHLPPLPDCVAGGDNERASMSLELSREAVDAAIRATARAIGAV